MKTFQCLLKIFSSVLLVFILSCSSDSPVDVDDNNNGGGNEQEEFNLTTVENALLIMDSAEELYINIAASQGMQAAADAALASLLAQTNVEHAEIGPDSTVWVFFKNGLLAGIYELDRDPTESVPQGNQLLNKLEDINGGGESIGFAVILNPIASEFGYSAHVAIAEMLDDCFGSEEDATAIYLDNQVTVQKVKEVLTAGPGVLLWYGHGCVVPVDEFGPEKWVVFMTGENYASEQMAEKLVNTYSSGANLSSFFREIVVVKYKGKHWLAVTPTFVTNYAEFDYLENLNYNGCKSVVFACCCWSGNSNGMMDDAFLSVGVDNYLGWTRAVSVSFANDVITDFFENATDTFTIEQAYDAIPVKTDPNTNAGLSLTHSPMMIRSQMNMKKDGSDLHGYSVGVVVDDVTMVNCFAGQPRQLPEYGVTVHFPGSNTGSWNCQTDDDALIAITDLTSGQLFIIQKDYVGVNATIDVSTYDEDIISGKFSGTLGYWTIMQNPEEDPPSMTISIQDGVFKHVGIRN